MNTRPFGFGVALRRLLLTLCALSVAAAAQNPTLPPKKRQPTPEKVIAEHIAALNACDWNRMMAQYDDDIVFLSKDGAAVSGREAIGQMFQKALQPPAKGGQCGMKLISERTIVVGNTVNVIWRAEAPFFAEPYRGSEAFETRNGLLAAQVTTWDYQRHQDEEVSDETPRARGENMNRLLPVIVMGCVMTLLATALAAQTQQEKAPAQREILTKAQFDELFKQVSNWGRWGRTTN